MFTTSHLSRYAAMVTHLATQALDAAGDMQAGMAIGMAAARGVISGDQGAVSPRLLLESGTRFDDSIGHTRPTYFALLIHLHARVSVDSAVIGELVNRMDTPKADTSEQLWRAVSLSHAGRHDEAKQLVEPIVQAPGPEGELAAFVQGQDLLDVWWYRELVSLHALFYLAHLSPLASAAWQQRCREVVLYHLENTQPDHTTAQPWAVAAFLHDPQAIPFGEQQLHDAQSYWTHGQPGSSLIPGLLLADAAGTMHQLIALEAQPS